LNSLVCPYARERCVTALYNLLILPDPIVSKMNGCVDMLK
jgi:hypothetical protein